MMGDNNRLPSMTALLGLLAVAGYQNRDKLAEWFGGGQPRTAQPGVDAPGSYGRASAPGQTSGGAPFGLDKILGGAGGAASAGGIGGLLGGGIQELIERFKQAGRGDAADSWVRSGPNQPVTEPDLEQAIGADVLAQLEGQTGLSRQEILARLSQRLPDAIDRYTPDGRLAG